MLPKRSRPLLALTGLVMLSLGLTACPSGPSGPGSTGDPGGSSGQPGSSAPGALDASFGEDGIVLTDLFDGADDVALAVTMQADGKFVAAGTSMSFQPKDIVGAFSLLRYLPDGEIDPGFGTQGRVLTGQGESGQAMGVGVNAGGRVLTSGWYAKGISIDFMLSRHLSDGTLDADFGDGGHAVAGLGSVKHGGLLLREDGGALVVGSGGTLLEHDALVVAFTAEGERDPDFGSDGLARIDLGSDSDEARAIARHGDKFYVAGYTPEHGFVLARLKADGSVDTSFGNAGRIVAGGDAHAARDLAIAPDGTIVMAGGAQVWRFTASGEVDAAFGSDGMREFEGFTFHAVEVQADGKILVAGGKDGEVALLRLTADGQLDGDFGKLGIGRYAVEGGEAIANAMLLDGKGGAILAGKAYQKQGASGSDDFLLLRVRL